MEAAAAAAAIDFSTLSRRELQALCKRNGVRANMTNAAMAEALQYLVSVDGIDEIGTTLCLPTPSRSAMKSVMKSAAAAADGEDQQQQQQQHGSPLPRGRRVSVRSPEAIRMDVEEGEDGMKRDLVKEIVRTPGVALRSTSRRARATPAPIPTPATLRRSQRTAGRNAAAPVEEHVSTAKVTTRRSARSKVVIDLDLEEEVEAPIEEKVQEEEHKDAASDEKCDGPGEKEVTVLEGNRKVEEQEQNVEVYSFAGPLESAVRLDLSCDDPKEDEVVVVVEEPAKQQEVAGIDAIVDGNEVEQGLISAEKSDTVPIMEDSPILGLLSKVAATVPVIEKVEDASAGDGGKSSPVKETTDNERSHVTEDMQVAASVVEEEGAVATDDETSEEDDIVEEDDETTDEVSLAGDEKCEEVEMFEEEVESQTSSDGDDKLAYLAGTETSEGEEEETNTDEIKPVDLTGYVTSEEDELVEEEEEDTTDETPLADSDLTGGETSTEDELGEAKKVSPREALLQHAVLRDGEASAEVDITGVTEENVETAEQSDFSEEEDDSGEEDDFSSDLPTEFYHAGNLTDTESDIHTTLPAPEEIASPAARAAVKMSLDDSDITAELPAPIEEVVSQQSGATGGEVTVEMNLPETRGVGAKEKKHQLKADDISLIKLKAMYKEKLLAAKEGKKQQVAVEGKRLPLVELAGNACADN